MESANKIILFFVWWLAICAIIITYFFCLGFYAALKMERVLLNKITKRVLLADQKQN